MQIKKRNIIKYGNTFHRFIDFMTKNNVGINSIDVFRKIIIIVLYYILN